MADANPRTQSGLEELPISEEHKKEKRIAVIETFGPTIQGEGPLAGSKTMFIRFGGCDYRCTKCDSLHAVIPAAVKKNAQYLTAQEIADRIIPSAKATGTGWVTLSGGNPAMWDLSELIKLLHAAELGVAVETQATIYQPWIAACQMVVISPKTPGMGERFEPKKFTAFLQKLQEDWKFREVKYGIPPGALALKIVIFSNQDLEYAIEIGNLAFQVSNLMHPGLLFLSLGNSKPPELDDENILVANKVAWKDHVAELLADYRILVEEMCQDPRISHFRFLPQIHVLVWGNEAEK
jgi:7-carboxy-7-deazaguanine synthase